MVEGVNRAAVLWKNWEAQQKALEGVFGSALPPRDLLRQEYGFLKSGVNSLGNRMSPGEQLMADLVKRHVVRLEKQLYPNPLIRLLVQVKTLVLDRPLQRYREGRLREENLASLSGTLRHHGFAAPDLRLQQHLDFVRPKVSLELGTRLYNTARYETAVRLEKDDSGHYRFLGFKGTVKDPVLGTTRSFDFDAASGITAKEAVHLLQGRAVRKQDVAGADKWVQLDFGSNGRVELLGFSKGYGYDLKGELARLGSGLQLPDLNKAELLRALEAGKQVSVRIGAEQYQLEASPVTKSVLVRDRGQRVVDVPVLLERLSEAKKILEKARTQGQDKVRSIRLDKNREQKQGRSLGMG